MGTATLARLTTGGFEVDTSRGRFGFLRESSDILNDPAATRKRMAASGYLYFPGFFEREQIRAVRLEMCRILADEGMLDPSEPIEGAIARPEFKMGFRPDIANNSAASEAIRRVIYGDKIMAFFSDLLGGTATHYDFTWLRTIAPGKGSQPHCDIIFMGRGTKKLYTAWIPFGDVPLHVGGLILLEGSHKNRGLRENYCSMDIDTACQNRNGVSQLAAAGFPGYGALSEDMTEVRRLLSYKLLTAEEYRMGDLLVFSTYTVHGSLDNQSREIRLSTDSRYQLASEPLDERWVGEHPPGHGGNSVNGMIC